MAAKLALFAFLALFMLSSSFAHPSRRTRDTQVKRASPITLPFVRRSNVTGTDIVKNDQARAKFLRNPPSSDDGSFEERIAKTKSACINMGITNAGVIYTIDVRSSRVSVRCTVPYGLPTGHRG